MSRSARDFAHAVDAYLTQEKDEKETLFSEQATEVVTDANKIWPEMKDEAWREEANAELEKRGVTGDFFQEDGHWEYNGSKS